MNEENKNKLFISNRDRGLSVAIFQRKEVNIKDGQLHTTYSANIQRSWQKPEDKGTDNWQRQSVSLFPDELLKVAALCVRTYNELTAGLQKKEKKDGIVRRQTIRRNLMTPRNRRHILTTFRWIFEGFLPRTARACG